MANTLIDGGQDGEKIMGWDGTATGAYGFSAAFIEVTTYSTPITVNCGVGAANPVQVINLANNATSATITGTGLYAFPAVGNLTLTGNPGTAVNLILKR